MDFRVSICKYGFESFSINCSSLENLSLNVCAQGFQHNGNVLKLVIFQRVRLKMFFI